MSPLVWPSLCQSCRIIHRSLTLWSWWALRMNVPSSRPVGLWNLVQEFLMKENNWFLFEAPKSFLQFHLESNNKLILWLPSWVYWPFRVLMALVGVVVHGNSFQRLPLNNWEVQKWPLRLYKLIDYTLQAISKYLLSARWYARCWDTKVTRSLQ